jgi:hypothetical protein
MTFKVPTNLKEYHQDADNRKSIETQKKSPLTNGISGDKK